MAAHRDYPVEVQWPDTHSRWCHVTSSRSLFLLVLVMAGCREAPSTSRSAPKSPPATSRPASPQPPPRVVRPTNEFAPPLTATTDPEPVSAQSPPQPRRSMEDLVHRAKAAQFDLPSQEDGQIAAAGIRR